MAAVGVRQGTGPFAGTGICLTAGALHTQRPTVEKLLALQLDFVLTVKDNRFGLAGSDR